jgi:hypothetical protein
VVEIRDQQGITVAERSSGYSMKRNRGFNGPSRDAVLTFANGKIGWEFANREPRVRKK